MDDNQIIALYFSRAESAIRETEKKYGNYCLSLASHILRDREDAKECVNDTWLRAWNAIPPARPSQLRLFLAKITRNLSFDRLKERLAKKRGGGEVIAALEELQECVSGSSDVETELEFQELTDSINRFLHTLPGRECSIFLRRYFYVEPVGDIAKRYAVKESNVLVILSRTRKKLCAYLEKEGYIL